MPCPSTGPKMFCAGPNFSSQFKNLIAFSAYSKTFALAQKPNLQNGNHLLVWHKMNIKFQNVLEPLEGRGISTYSFLIYTFE